MKIDARTCSAEERAKYTASVDGQIPCFILAADDEEGWIDVIIRRDANLDAKGFLTKEDGQPLTARIFGDVKIIEVSSLGKNDEPEAVFEMAKKIESSSNDLTE